MPLKMVQTISNCFEDVKLKNIFHKYNYRKRSKKNLKKTKNYTGIFLTQVCRDRHNQINVRKIKSINEKVFDNLKEIIQL